MVINFRYHKSMNMLQLLKVAVALLATSNLGNAQSLSFSSEDPESPIEVLAERGIEWQQSDKRFIARGSARATQGEVTVLADTIIAHYRDNEEGNTDIYRVDAIGDVTIQTSTEKATGSAAVYDFDQSVLVIEGEPVRLETDGSVVTAEDTLQYWEAQRVAVAEGNASAEQEGQQLKADKLTAYFKDSPEGADEKIDPRGSGISKLFAFGNVRLDTGAEVIRGDRGSYDLETGIATLDGSVKITQEQNQMNGGFAVVDTNKKVSTLYASAREAGMQPPTENSRVRALIAPRPRQVGGTSPDG